MHMITTVLLQQRSYMFEWIPVALAVGIGCYFQLRFEPSVLHLGLIAGIGGICVIAARCTSEAFSPLILGCALIAAGFLLAAHRAHDVAGPVIGWRYYGPVEGRIVNIDRSGSDALRLTLDQVVLERVRPSKTPHKVRISLHGDQTASVNATPGLRIMTTAHLSPPGGPVEPGGFDFQRHAWFGGLGAVGYTRVPVLAIAPAHEGAAGLAKFRLRMAAAARVQETLPGDVGGVAVAVTTGARSGISQQALEDLRASNLAHLLAISGLHMGLLSGFVFALIRAGLSLIPPLALRINVKKTAAVVALASAAMYLAMSGGNVATERAFVMVAVALSAVLINRRAISLRGVAIAAVIVLCLRPEALLGPGFQMSFAATTALVAIFGYFRDAKISTGPRWALPVTGVLLSSGIAGFATAPIGAAHFNALAHYGLLANLLSVPVMGTVVVPAAVVAALLAPFGLDWVGLWIMGLGLQWVLNVGTFVSGLDGARSFVPGPGAAVLPTMALGCLFVILWQGRLRILGFAPVALSFLLWFQADRPVALIAENGTLVGLMTNEGRALSKPKGAGFIARNWLENDGEPALQEAAARRWPGDGSGNLPSGHSMVHLSGKAAAAGFAGCGPGEIVVANHVLDQPDRGCHVFDPAKLQTTGAIAVHATGNDVKFVSVRDVTGTRLWTNWKDDRPD